MKISSTQRSQYQVQGSSAPSPKQSSSESPSYFDRFQSQAASELPSAMIYTALGGAALGVVSSLGTGSLSSLAQGVGMSSAVGAGVGLAAGLAVSLVKAALTEPVAAPSPQVPAQPEPTPPEPQVPVPPAPPKPEPKPSPEELFLQDMKRADGILERRVQALNSLVNAERTYTDSGGRNGLRSRDAAEKVFRAGGDDWKALSKKRAATVSVEDQSSVSRNLSTLRRRQQQVLDLSVRAEQVVTDSRGRAGRLSSRSAEQLSKELDNEATRLKKALGER